MIHKTLLIKIHCYQLLKNILWGDGGNPSEFFLHVLSAKFARFKLKPISDFNFTFIFGLHVELVTSDNGRNQGRSKSDPENGGYLWWKGKFGSKSAEMNYVKLIPAYLKWKLSFNIIISKKYENLPTFPKMLEMMYHLPVIQDLFKIQLQALKKAYNEGLSETGKFSC